MAIRRCSGSITKMIETPTIKIRGLRSDGYTVRELIWELSRFDPYMRVVQYTSDGETYPVIKVAQDSRNKVAIF